MKTRAASVLLILSATLYGGGAEDAILLSGALSGSSTQMSAYYSAMAAGTSDKKMQMMYMMMAMNSQAQAQAAARAKKQNEENKKKNDEKSADDKNKVGNVPMPTEYKNTFVVPKAPEENLDLAGKIDMDPKPVRASLTPFEAPIMNLAGFSLGLSNKTPAQVEAEMTAPAPKVVTLSPIEKKAPSYNQPENVGSFTKPAPIVGALQGSPSIKPQDNPVDLWKPDHKESGGRRVKQEEPGEDRSIASEPEEKSSKGSDANALFEAIFGQLNQSGDDGVSLGEDLVERNPNREPVPTLFEMASIRYQYAARYEGRLKSKQNPQVPANKLATIR